MKTTIFPTLEEALELHLVLIEKFGGSTGIRDQGLLESALIRPQMEYYGSLSQQAAALLQSLSRNHPFLDGNKRMAFALTAIFLDLNGYDLIVETDAAHLFIVDDVIRKHKEVDEIATWLERHMTKRT